MRSGLLFVLAMIAWTSAAVAQDKDKCWSCHSAATPGIVEQWKASKHFANDVGCLDCHGTEASDPDAFAHQGATVAIIVSPKDCAQCHHKEFQEQKGSHHAKAGQILGSLDNASMQGPDYTWWHGIYEVSKHFYEKFIPQLEEAAGEEVVKELLDQYVYTQEGHLWHRDGMSKEALEKIRAFYKERYKQ